MPFCSQCGNQVGPGDGYCGRCGARQPVAGATRPARTDPLTGVTPRTASILCYVPGVGWIASIIVLASERFRHLRPVRFHAFQGLYLFVAWLMSDWVLRSIFIPIVHFHPFRLVELLLLGMSVFMMIKASQDEMYSLPVFGELAERSLAEN
jgi:uncharacterized membrane protein